MARGEYKEKYLNLHLKQEMVKGYCESGSTSSNRTLVERQVFAEILDMLKTGEAKKPPSTETRGEA